MNLRNRAKLSLENLESRWCPAVSVTNPNGVLTVTGDPVGPVTITQTGPGVYTVAETGGTTVPAVAATNGVSVTFQGSDDSLTINTNGAPITGSISVNLGNGDDTFLLQNGGAVLTVQGNLLVTTGTGDDTVNLSPGGAVTVSGITSINMGPSVGFTGDDLLFIQSDVTLQGGLTVQDANTLNLAGAVAGQTTIVNNYPSPLGTNTISLLAGSTITGNLSVVGSSGDDSVTLAGTVTGTANVYLGEADVGNTFLLDTTGLVQQALQFNGGNANDTVTLNGTVRGSATVNLRGGTTNSLNMAGTTAIVQGSLNVTGAGAANNLTFDADSRISGNLVINLSTGTNQTLFGGRLGGSSLSYTGGGGQDTFSFQSPAVAGGAALSINLGAGNDTFNLASNSYRSLSADGGAGTDTITVTGTATIKSGSRVVNFEA